MSDNSLPPSQPPPDPAKRRRMARAPSGVAVVLQDGERIMQTAVISAGIYWKAIVVLGMAVLLLLLPPLFNLALFFLIISALVFIAAWLTKHYLLLMLTDRRAILRYGILSLETVQLHYNKIESIELAWTPMGRLLGYATVLITGTGSRVTGIPFVANAVALRAEFDRLISVQEDKPIHVHVDNPA